MREYLAGKRDGEAAAESRADRYNAALREIEAVLPDKWGWAEEARQVILQALRPGEGE